jgi:methylated-DNA-[protein]-cysteine S-methyltransferase
MGLSCVVTGRTCDAQDDLEPAAAVSADRSVRDAHSEGTLSGISPLGAMKRQRPSDFAARVLAAVCRIPPGRIATYGDIARVAGRPRAARAVGNIMRACDRPGVPCHRVVAAGGRLGGYGGNVELKRSLLRAEGVTVVGLKIRDPAVRRWRR